MSFGFVSIWIEAYIKESVPSKYMFTLIKCITWNDSLTNEGRRQRKCHTNAQRDLICRAPGTDL